AAKSVILSTIGFFSWGFFSLSMASSRKDQEFHTAKVPSGRWIERSAAGGVWEESWNPGSRFAHPGCACLYQLHPQMPAHRLRRSGKSAERHRLVLGIEKTIKLGAAGFHARREFGLGDFLAPHQFGRLPRQYAFDRARGRIFIDAVLFQEVIEGR